VTRDVPVRAATSAADSPGDARNAVRTRSNVAASRPFGSVPGGLPRRVAKTRSISCWAAASVDSTSWARYGVPVELVAERGERERLQQVVRHPQGDRLPDHRQVAGRRDREDIGAAAGRPQGADQAQAVPVGKIQIQKHQIDFLGTEHTHRLPRGVRHPGHLEPADPLGVTGHGEPS
jgi:hypothetical protein